MCYISEAPHAREALYLAPWLSKSTHPRKFGNYVTVRPHHRKTNVYSLSLGAQERTNCISVLRSIDSCQNRASADQYHLTVPRAQGSTHRGRVFLKLSADKLTVSNDRRLKFVFSNDLYQIRFVYVTMAPHY